MQQLRFALVRYLRSEGFDAPDDAMISIDGADIGFSFEHVIISWSKSEEKEPQ